MTAKKRLGEMLIDAGIIGETQLKAALGHQRQWGVRIGQALVDLKLASEADIVQTLATKYGYEVARLEGLEAYALEQALALLPREFALHNNVFPMAADTQTVTVAMSDPTNLAVVDEIRFRTGRRVKVCIGGDRELAEALRAHYPGDQAVEPIALDLEADEGQPEAVFDPFGGGSKDALEAFFGGGPEPAQPAARKQPAPAAAPPSAPAPHGAAAGKAAAAPQQVPAAPAPPPPAAKAAQPAPPVPASPPPAAKAAAPAPRGAATAKAAAAQPAPAVEAAPAPAPPARTQTRPAVPAQPAPAAPAARPATGAAPAAAAVAPAASPPPRAAAVPAAPAAPEPVLATELEAAGGGAEDGLAPRELAILQALERLAGGGHAEPEIVKPAQAMAALIRLLIRLGVITEREFLDELQGR